MTIQQRRLLEVVGQIQNVNDEVVPMRVLLNTGTSSTIVLRNFVHEISQYKTKPVNWSTMGGQFLTRRKTQIKLKLPESSTNKTITWTAHVDESTDPKQAMLDLIIGADLMEALAIDISFNNKNTV